MAGPKPALRKEEGWRQAPVTSRPKNYPRRIKHECSYIKTTKRTMAYPEGDAIRRDPAWSTNQRGFPAQGRHRGATRLAHQQQPDSE